MTDNVQLQINALLHQGHVVLDKVIVSLLEVRQMEELAETLRRGSELDGLDVLLSKLAQVKRAITDSLNLVHHLEGLVMQLYDSAESL